MSTEDIKNEVLLDIIQSDFKNNSQNTAAKLRNRYSNLTADEAEDLARLIIESMKRVQRDKATLVFTVPYWFRTKGKSTEDTFSTLIDQAQNYILLTGYAMTDYFSSLIDKIINKSKEGVYVRIFINDLDSQPNKEKLLSSRSNFFKLYNYLKKEDQMAALHAKVLLVDYNQVLITSANLSYHGQKGNIEIGTLLESKKIAEQIDDFFSKLVIEGIFHEI